MKKYLDLALIAFVVINIVFVTENVLLEHEVEDLQSQYLQVKRSTETEADSLYKASLYLLNVYIEHDQDYFLDVISESQAWDDLVSSCDNIWEELEAPYGVVNNY